MLPDLIDITTNTLTLNTFCFESKDIDLEKIPVPLENAKFGILNFAAVTASETISELEFLFIIDCSGSMSDRCLDGRTKMQHIIHTLKNMILFLHEKSNINVNITVNTFDTNIYRIVERTKITDDNINDIFTNIEKIQPKGSTNIEYALEKSAEEIKNLKNSFPTHIVNHIFMTDGEATEGSTDINILKNMVIEDTMNCFIGFGIEHDSALLNELGTVSKSSYYFVDKLESSGFVYGEILHSIIYKILTDVEINIKNGLIYNYQNNSWTNKLFIGDIISESNKIYNIVSDNIHEFKAEIIGKIDNLVILYPSMKIEDFNSDLTKHIFRQRTLQLMYEVNEFCKKKRELDNKPNYNINFILIDFRNLYDEITSIKNTLRQKLFNFMNEMKKYMVENNLDNDKFMKNLCDDIYICLKTFDTKYGNMYCTARQTSQGTQRQYTVSNTVHLDNDDNIFQPYNIPRNYIYGLQDRFEFEEDIPLNLPIIHDVSDFTDTPYLTPQATQVIRFVSNSYEENILTQENY